MNRAHAGRQNVEVEGLDQSLEVHCAVCARVWSDQSTAEPEPRGWVTQLGGGW